MRQQERLSRGRWMLTETILPTVWLSQSASVSAVNNQTRRMIQKPQRLTSEPETALARPQRRLPTELTTRHTPSLPEETDSKMHIVTMISIVFIMIEHHFIIYEHLKTCDQ